MRRVVGGVLVGIAVLLTLSAIASVFAEGDFMLFLGSLIMPGIVGAIGWWTGDFGSGARGAKFGGTTEDQARLARDQAVSTARERREATLEQQRAEMAAMRAEMRRAAEARNRELGI